jgi:hypothetical protein
MLHCYDIVFCLYLGSTSTILKSSMIDTGEGKVHPKRGHEGPEGA